MSVILIRMFKNNINQFACTLPLTECFVALDNG